MSVIMEAASKIRERPILFSAEMVRAILDGRKTMTRQEVKLNESGRVARGGRQWHIDDPVAQQACPYGQPGDRLWVRETWMPGYDHEADHENGPRVSVIYRADNAERTVAAPSYEFAEQWERDFSDDGDEPLPWRPSIYMPRWASRITPEITSVRIERLQDISEEDAIREGIRELPLQENEPGAWWCADPLGNSSLHCRTPRAAFARLWGHINGAGSWDANPWVWVIDFKRVIQ